MRAEGTPILVRGDSSRPLKRIRIGGKDNGKNEKWLQELIQSHPDCIPMDQIEPGLARLIPVCMELQLQSGYVDNLLMTPEGDIIVVETKLWRNPEARREVVAQALDYATSLFKMDYGQLETQVLKAQLNRDPPPASLYELFDDPDTLDEPAFVDAVNKNLRDGRIVVLVVGDGIRSEVMDLTDGLQSHAGFHFTFALVELAVFQGDSDDTFIVVPRTLANTCMIERGIVRIDDQRAEVVPAPEVVDKAARPAARQSITSEQFYSAMEEFDSQLPDRLKAFVQNLAKLGVYADLKRSLNLKWDPPKGKPINVGYIMRNGRMWTDAVHWSVPDQELSKAYIEALAQTFGGHVYQSGKHQIVAKDSHAPRIETLMDDFDGWYEAIEKFIMSVREYLEEEAAGEEQD